MLGPAADTKIRAYRRVFSKNYPWWLRRHAEACRRAAVGTVDGSDRIRVDIPLRDCRFATLDISADHIAGAWHGPARCRAVSVECCVRVVRERRRILRKRGDIALRDKNRGRSDRRERRRGRREALMRIVIKLQRELQLLHVRDAARITALLAGAVEAGEHDR